MLDHINSMKNTRNEKQIHNKRPSILHIFFKDMPQITSQGILLLVIKKYFIGDCSQHSGKLFPIAHKIKQKTIIIHLQLLHFQSSCSPAHLQSHFPSPLSMTILSLYLQFIALYHRMKGGAQHHTRNLKGFVILLAITQIVIIVLYGVFVRFKKTTDVSLNADRYPAYQDVNVMMLVGFGFLMAFSKSFSWSAVSYTFFMNAVMVQIYILLSAFWKRVIITGFNSTNYYIYIDQESFTSALYSAASMFISLGVVIGRVGPLECLIMSLVHQVGYTLNQVICYDQIKAFDVGGSMTIHTFGAYSGIVSSLILTAIAKPASKAGSNYFSNLFAMIGSLFLWMYWPSFNFGVFSPTPFTKTQIIGNTILSLTGSCLSTFITSALVKEKFTMEHILNASLAGGVVIGATAGIIFHPAGSLAIGFLTGIVSTLGFQYLTPYLEKRIGLYDTCGVHNLHAMPGLIGGFVSAIVAASFAYSSATDAYPITANELPVLSALLSTPYKQGGLQIAATFTSAGIGIVTALIGGIFLRFVYSFNETEFFTDTVYFEEAGEFIEELNIERKGEPLEYAKVNDKTLGAEAFMNNTQEYLKPNI